MNLNPKMMSAKLWSLSLVVILACFATLHLAACSQGGAAGGAQTVADVPSAPQVAIDQQVPIDQQSGVPVLNDQEVLAAQNAQAVKTMVTATMPVKRLLPADTKGRAHQKFLLNASNGTTILVAHSTDSAPEVPIQPGDVITIHGEYIWNKKGGLIHWTHHSDTPRHEGGYIDFNGKRYQ